MGRYVALVIVLTPILLAGTGFKLMRDAIFAETIGFFSIIWVQFLVGLVCFVAGIAFVGGWIFYRDRKRRYVAKRFKKRSAQK